MVVEQLQRVRIVAPAKHSPDLLTTLLKFGEFHPATREDAEISSRLGTLYERSRRLYLDLEAAVRLLEVEAGGGVVEVLLRGEPEPQNLDLENVEELCHYIEERSRPILSKLKGTDARIEELRTQIDRVEKEASRLSIQSAIGLDLSALYSARRLYVAAFIASTRDLEEIMGALEEASVAVKPLERGSSLLLVVSKVKNRERVERILRTFNLTPIEPVAFEALEKLSAHLTELKETLSKLRDEFEGLQQERVKIKAEWGSELISLRDLARGLMDSIQRIGGGAGRLVVLEGYIPSSMREEFLREVGGLAYVDISPIPQREAHIEGHEEKPPTRMRNNWFTEAFKPVTLIQGPPSYYEIDPTPIVSIFLTIFYGIMFADLGQGLVIAALGLVLSMRAKGSLKLWGRLLLILGASAATTGFLIQEAFGFKLSPITGIKPILELIEHHGGSAALNTEAVITLFSFAPLLGFIHVSIGLGLAAYILFRQGEYGEAIFSKVTSLAMYVFGLLFALAFLTVRGFGTLFTSQEPVPLLGLPVSLVGNIGVYGVLLCIALLVGGRLVSSFFGLFPKASPLSHIGTGLLEVLENIIHFMSNTLSYLRISILMIIHVALMFLINSAWEALSYASIGILIIGNIGVMGLEGLLVFIQALRLHLYEFFTKFFTGEGILFKPLSLASPRLRVVFK